MIFNINNYLNFFRIFFIFKSPIKFIYYIILKKIPTQIFIKTPVGLINLNIRNYESLRTIFSIFCRQDYIIENDTYHYIDIGANCGYSAAYFLSRNKTNTIECYEPDKLNYAFLEKNLQQFNNRFSLKTTGVGPYREKSKFYITNDGKYSSTIKNESNKILEIDLIPLSEILDNVINIESKKIVIKIDVEGIEEDIVRSIDFSNYRKVCKLIIESTECGKILSCDYTSKIVNGYIEHISLNI